MTSSVLLGITSSMPCGTSLSANTRSAWIASIWCVKRVSRAGCPCPEPSRMIRLRLGVGEKVCMGGGSRGLSAVSSSISSSQRVASLERGLYSLTWATHLKRCRVDCCRRVYSCSADALDLRGEPRSVSVIDANAMSVRPVSSTSWSHQLAFQDAPLIFLACRPPFARMYTCEASAPRAANARNAANGLDHMMRIPLVARRKERIREVPVRRSGNIGGGYMHTILIVQGLEKKRQAAW